jgi:hypothetical protein
MGVVYRTRHVLLHRDCVLKMILAGDYSDAHAVARFLFPGDLGGEPNRTAQVVVL